MATAEAAVRRYETAIGREASVPNLSEIQQQLSGLDLVCWCPLDQPCHADVLIKMANEGRGSSK
jgi:hypothetical protein